MNKDDFKLRTRQFALRAIKLVEALPKGRSADVISRQLLRSATSVGANYRAACRARSTAEFLSKMGIVEEEADECVYWLELVADSELLPETRLQEILDEANQIVAVTVASIKTARKSL
ncbi:MAG: four helix bundle protein [Planctomycetes bacterium]|nr:four helix bundle protein [Planctomycetota bacterium]